MAIQTLNPPPNNSSEFNTGDSLERGDSPRQIATKANAMFTELYAADAAATARYTNVAEIATYGDSRLALGMLLTTNGTEGRSSYTTIQGIQGWLQSQLRGRAWFPADLHFAVSGYNTANMLAILPSVVASRAKIVIMLGGTNNSFTSQGGLDSAKSDMLTMLLALGAVGKRVILVAELPRGNSTYTANRVAGGSLPFWMEYRRWLLEVCARLPGVTIIDPWSTMVIWNSTTADILLAVSDDGLHNNPLGYLSYFVPHVYAVLDKWLASQANQWPTDNSDPWAATNPHGNLLANGMMDGSGGTLVGGITGVLPTSWTGSVSGGWSAGTSMGIVGSKVAATNFEWLQLALSGTAAASTGSFDIRQTLNTANLAAGDKIRAYGVCEIDAAFTGMREVDMILIASSSGNTYEAKSLHGSTGFNIPVNTYVGNTALYQMTPEVVIGTLPLTGASLRLNHLPIASGTISATVRWGKLAVRKIINEGY